MEKTKWIYNLGLPSLNYHIAVCRSQNLTYEQTLECLLKVLAQEHKLLEIECLDRLKEKLCKGELQIVSGES